VQIAPENLWAKQGSGKIRRMQAGRPAYRERMILRALRAAAAHTPPWKPEADKAYIADLACEAGVTVQEAAPVLVALHKRKGDVLSMIDLVAAADPKKLRASHIDTGSRYGAELVRLSALTGRTPNGGYYVWVLGKDGRPLLEGPYGPHELTKAKQLARIGATEGEHNRAVSRGLHPTEPSFEIVREYEAGSGERVL